MSIKSITLAAALLAFPAVFAPAHAGGIALPQAVVDAAALDASAFGVSIGSRGRVNVGVHVGRKKEVSNRRVIVRGVRVGAF